MKKFIITEEQYDKLLNHLILNENIYQNWRQSVSALTGKAARGIRNPGDNLFGNFLTIGGPNNAVYKKQFPGINIDRLNKSVDVANRSSKRASEFGLVGTNTSHSNGVKELQIQTNNGTNIKNLIINYIEKVFDKISVKNQNTTTSGSTSNITIESSLTSNELTDLKTGLMTEIDSNDVFVISNDKLRIKTTKASFISRPNTRTKDHYKFDFIIYLDTNNVKSLSFYSNPQIDQNFKNFIDNLEYVKIKIILNFTYDPQTKKYIKLKIEAQNPTLVSNEIDITNLLILK